MPQGASNKTATTGKESFKCKDCVYASETRKSDILRHYKQVHASVQAKKEMSFICNNGSCGKEFIQRSNAEIHAIVHTGEKPFTCKFCKTSFVDQSPLSKPCLVANTNGTVKHSMLKPFDKAAFMKKHAAVYKKIKPPMRDATEEEKQSWVVSIFDENVSVKPVKRAAPNKRSAGKASRSKKGGKEEDFAAEDDCDDPEALRDEDDIADAQSEQPLSVVNTTRVTTVREASPGAENEIPSQQIQAAEDLPFNNIFGIHNTQYLTQQTASRRFNNDGRFNPPTDSLWLSGGILEGRSPSPPLPVSCRDSFERTKICVQHSSNDIEAAMILLEFATTSSTSMSSEGYDDDDVEEAAKGLLELSATTPLRELDITQVTPVGTPFHEGVSAVSYYDSEMAEAAMILVQALESNRRKLGSDSRAGTPSTVVGAPSPANTQTSTIAAGSPAVSKEGDHYDSTCPTHCKGCEKVAELKFAEEGA